MPTKIVSFLQLIRLPAGCSVISNILAAHSIATQGDIQFSALAFSLIAGLCLYFGGMILNDCFDYSEDCQDRPNRPLPSQQISRKTARFSATAFLISGCVSASFINQQMLLVSAILTLLIVLYDSNLLPPWPSAVTMGLCRYTNWIMALAVLPLSLSTLLTPIPILFYVIALTRLSQVETSTASTPRLVELSLFLVLAFISLIFLAQITLFSALFLILLGSYYLALILPLIKSHTAKQIQDIVSKLIFGLIPFDAAICLIFGYWEIASLLLLLIPFSRVIGQKLYIS